MEQHVAYHAKGVLVNVFQVVVQCVPHIGKTFVAAFGLQVDDVDGGDARDFVHRDVVVTDGRPQFIVEVGTVAQVVGHTPNLVADCGGVALRIIFFGEVGVAAAHHVQENAVVGLVAIYMWMLGPILRAQSPIVHIVIIVFLGFFRVGAVVLKVEKDDVDSEFFRQSLGLEETGAFKQYAYAASTVVGTIDGRVDVGLIGVVVSVGA